MTSPARVLLLGHDEATMEAMAIVLRHFWDVEKAIVHDTFKPAIHAELAVMCDSIEEPWRQKFVEILRAEVPSLLIVKLNGYDSGPHAHADATVDSVHGPGALVSTIYELLTERGFGTRDWPPAAGTLWLQ